MSGGVKQWRCMGFWCPGQEVELAPFHDFFQKICKMAAPKQIKVIFKSDKKKKALDKFHLTNSNFSLSKMCQMVSLLFFLYRVDFSASEWLPGHVPPCPPSYATGVKFEWKCYCSLLTIEKKNDSNLV